MPRLSALLNDRGRGDFLVATSLAAAVAAVFWVPSAEVARGYFPAPLDDVYIHFDFARSLGKGRFFQWIPDQGYSSGETSPLYAFALAVGWVFGFRGRALGVWAAIVAILSVASLLRTIRRFVRPCPSWLAWLIALLPLSIGVVDWALFSGMEVALFAAALGRALEALAHVRRPRGALTFESRQWRLGWWGAALVLLRPEAAVIVAVFAVVATRGARRRSGIMAVLRASLPGALATLGVLAANWLATGDARSAGAQLKLLSSNPYYSDEDRARAFAENLVTFWVKVVRGELAVVPGLLVILPALALVGLAKREHRAVAGACLVSAIAWILIVSWNGNAPYHNFRYYAPALVLVSISAALGLSAIARIQRGRLVATALGASAITVAALKIPGQARHFRAAAANIRDQQIEVGERLARLPADAKILLGDAGAIPYVSGRTAVDALGLGGYRRMPFARAAVHGEAATVELIERLKPADRPTHFALYPNWFGALTSRFGVEIDRVTIEGNVICGGPTKAIYRADWSALAPHRSSVRDGWSIVDEIDVGDILDEADHAYVAPLPHGGWTTLDILVDESGTRRFDGGRIIPDGNRERFVVRHGANGPLTLRVRIDAGARGIALRTSRVTTDLVLEPARDGAWRTAATTLDGIEAHEIVTLEARGGEYRNYHVWIERMVASTR
ncbi:MAG TPA: hypothetical protein VM580_15010 [Labilithrix sp.]|nr:hypothetical protein [Labilithrix sp.]